MAKSDYMAHDDEGRAQQFIVFRDNIGQFLVPLGIPATDPDIIQQAADATRFRAMVDFQATMQQAAKGWTAEKNYERDGGGSAPGGQSVPVLPHDFPAAVPAGITPRFRLLVKRLNGNSKFTDAMAKALGVQGPDQVAPDLTTIQPDIEVVISGNHTEVDWGWGGYTNYLDMCLIQVDRGDGKGFVDLCYDTTPGYNDTQPFPATPTKWTYRAIYRVNDTNVGLWSKTVSITVGG
jgi:hypothetical protein